MDLTTTYLGLKLRNPIIVGASPFCDETFLAQQLEDAGAAAVVMRSLFAEQFDVPKKNSRAVAGDGVVTTNADYAISPEQYLRQLAQLKRSLTIPVIASLNGCQPGGWTDFAVQLERAGADAIELNAYQVVTNPGIAADEVETQILETLGSVAGSVRIPVAVKISPFHTSITQLAVALELMGAAGVVVFNRFYQPDINVDDLEVQPHLRLSDRSELLLRLRWLAILSPQLRGSIGAAGGIQNAEDIVKCLLTGAHAVQVVSILLRHGPHLLTELLTGLRLWMEHRGYHELAQIRGMLNHRRTPDPSAYERANYIRVLQSWRL